MITKFEFLKSAVRLMDDAGYPGCSFVWSRWARQVQQNTPPHFFSDHSRYGWKMFYSSLTGLHENWAEGGSE